MKVKEDSENTGLKLSIQTTKIMASGPITHGKQMGNSENSGSFSLLGSRISVDVTAAMKSEDTCSLEEKWKSLSGVWLFVTPWTIQSKELFRQEYWSG